jgi:hypothetical protein
MTGYILVGITLIIGGPVVQLLVSNYRHQQKLKAEQKAHELFLDALERYVDKQGNGGSA